jgi:uncharacterized protein
MSNLGYCYEHGEGRAQDYLKAAEWCARQADPGEPYGKFALRHLYHNGYGVPQNHEVAFGLAWSAGTEVDPGGQYNVGELYWKGVGVPADKVRAYAWMVIAGNSGDPDAPNDLVSFASSMSPDEVTAGQALAARCVGSGFSDC